MPDVIPKAILSDALHERIGGRRVRVAVFTTFAFEPGFFEEEVLPILFEQSFSHVPRLRLVQMEEALRSVDHVAVYYDRGALVTGGTSASLDVRRIPMSRGTGFFHPKILLLLVEAKDDSMPDALVVAVMSANLTRAGWWENVECACIHEVVDGSRCSFRQDLLELMRWIRRDEVTGEPHTALEAIRTFLHYRIEDNPFRSAQGTMHPRIFTGAESVDSFLDETLRLPRETFNLEVISPYFDTADDAGTLQKLIETLAPKETRIFLPQADDGAALCRSRYFESVASLRAVKWGKLPRGIIERVKGDDQAVSDRFVHAKVYRLWSRAEGREYLLVGSVNLTRAAHTKATAGNLEAAILLDRGPGQTPTFWLEALEDNPQIFRVEEAEEATDDAEPPPLSIRHLWDENRTEYFWEREEGRAPAYAIFSSAGADIHRLERIVFDEWTPLPDDVSRRISALLQSTSFLEVKVEGEPASIVLIREEGMAHKPSILFSLTSEEILRYWSLLSPEQREAFLSDKAHALLVSEGLASPRVDKTAAQDSLFDRFSGIFHAFSRLDEHVSNAIEQGRTTEAVYRLFGRKYDSLPSLIDRVLEEDDGDLVNRYVTLLTARQLLNRLKRKYEIFFSEHKQEERTLQVALSNMGQFRKQFDFASREEMDRFFRWFERMFFQEIQPRSQA